MKKFFLSLYFFSAVSACLFSQVVDSSYLRGMKWRMIGPYRGGRTVGAVGVAQQPNIFYIGANNGGVWKTTDYGRTWMPVFDDQPTGSVGDVAVAPSNPNVVYVGSGEGLHRPDLSVGNGMYRSKDAGKSWVHLGLDSVQQIGGLAIDPRDENKVFVAALGHPYGPNTERGVYRTVDGGKTWEKVLYKDENTGAIQVNIDPKNPDIIYADLWQARQGPWENGQWGGPESGLYKSSDGGTTWKKLTNGLPTTKQGLGRIGFCIAPSDPKRLYATVDAGKNGGIFRSDDAGESWTLMTNDERFSGRGSDFAEIKVDPNNADIVYSADVVVWKSTDGAKTWKGFRGAPGGDDYHRIWINPNNSDIILIASDQGAVITVNGGATFSSWYNQPTAQMYHVSTDNAFPYNVYSGQQESGSVSITSRGNDGQITFQDWHPVGAEEYGYVAADPLDPNIVYGGKITRFDKRTGQVQNISPEVGRGGKYRFVRTAPVIFSQADKKTLLYAANVLFKTLDGGNHWDVISPDLTRETWDIPKSVGIYATDGLKTMPRRGVIYTIAPSPKDINTIWCGTDDGLIQLTNDGGKTWKNVTPPAITSWNKISLMDASHFDVNVAYASVNCIRLDDMHPYIYRTKDGGKTWSKIVGGLPDDPINVVREDPSHKGLLFAGSEKAVYVSFDDGEHWQSLRLNMPATSIRDLVIKDDDLVIGTHGRGFWILDDIAALRQMSSQSAKEPIVLYKPANAVRVRWSMWTDTPLPQEEPAGENPPDGAIIDYYLKEPSNQELVLDIFDADNRLVRRFSSNDTLYKIPNVNIPLYWIRPQQILSSASGAHRFVWDMHYTPLNLPPAYPIGAVYKNTAPSATSPWVIPGTYTIKLYSSNDKSKSLSQTFTIKIDPRVKTSTLALKQQFDASLLCYENRKKCMATMDEIKVIRRKLKDKMTSSVSASLKTLQALDQKAAAIENPSSEAGQGLARLNGIFASVFIVLQEADVQPTSQALTAEKSADELLKTVLSDWAPLKIQIEKALVNN